ncbi:MAG: transglycosylase SLT domain-containing protein, partial [Deltaproteobacteria bacterium]|nr:transglycosylase SLT domain-containing protein [Deltaproteobacteria bacterium]
MKHPTPSANQFAMRALRWVVMLLAFSVVGTFAAERASLPRVYDASRSERQLVSGTELAQRLPFERNKIEPIDPKAAFVEGYQAYKHRDLIATIGRMQFAASRLPDLADYALFYLASAERDNGDSQAAANDFRRLMLSYPQSVWSDDAGLEYARLELKLGHPDYAITAATRVADSTNNPVIEQYARLTIAYALLATNSWHDAYNQAQMIRQKFPTGPADPPARQLAYATLQAHPQVLSAPPLEYHRAEAALLLREGQAKAALGQIQAAMALQPSRPIQAELTWFSAEASRGQPDRMKVELPLYLELAPRGAEAARALNGLAHLYWHENDTQTARLYFRRLPREFPHDELARAAMFEIGRTYEEDGNLQSARKAYLDLVGRYPGTEEAADGRFRAGFMLYMLGRYKQAAAEFNESRAHAATSSARDMFTYWQARALENSGAKVESRRLFESLALSTSSNYYPALAALRINQTANVLPAAFAADLMAGAVPAANGPVQFHLTRIEALRGLGLRELEAPELRATENHIGGNNSLQKFVLAELQSAGAWFDAIQMAIRMAARGEIGPATAERIRYPRGFWDLVAAASGRNQLDPYMVTALIRQESLFNPQARSTSDARGLMQLLPATANRYAAAAGITASAIDLYDPNISIQLGTAYLRALMGMFGGDIFKVVAAYNGGEHSVSQWNARYPGDNDQWVENIGFRETRDYVKKVIGGM